MTRTRHMDFATFKTRLLEFRQESNQRRERLINRTSNRSFPRPGSVNDTPAGGNANTNLGAPGSSLFSIGSGSLPQTAPATATNSAFGFDKNMLMVLAGIAAAIYFFRK